MAKTKRKYGMFEGASHIIFENAKELRRNLTTGEMNLWLHLRKGINGYKFRRQHPIGKFVADFFSYKAKMIIEIDGSIHNLPDVKDIDDFRQKDLEALGYLVLRFTNFQALNEVEKIIEEIKINLPKT